MILLNSDASRQPAPNKAQICRSISVYGSYLPQLLLEICFLCWKHSIPHCFAWQKTNLTSIVDELFYPVETFCSLLSSPFWFQCWCILQTKCFAVLGEMWMCRTVWASPHAMAFPIWDALLPISQEGKKTAALLDAPSMSRPAFRQGLRYRTAFPAGHGMMPRAAQTQHTSGLHSPPEVLQGCCPTWMSPIPLHAAGCWQSHTMHMAGGAAWLDRASCQPSIWFSAY